MIEIRAEEGAPVAQADGGHHHEQTRAIAAAIAEAVRLLNCATMAEKRGLAYPSDVYSVFGELQSAVALLPQALTQMAEWVRGEVEAGRARENASYGPYSGDASMVAVVLASIVRDATQDSNRLAKLLSEGQLALRGMEAVRVEDDL